MISAGEGALISAYLFGYGLQFIVYCYFNACWSEMRPVSTNPAVRNGTKRPESSCAYGRFHEKQFDGCWRREALLYGTFLDTLFVRQWKFWSPRFTAVHYAYPFRHYRNGRTWSESLQHVTAAPIKRQTSEKRQGSSARVVAKKTWNPSVRQWKVARSWK